MRILITWHFRPVSRGTSLELWIKAIRYCIRDLRARPVVFSSSLSCLQKTISPPPPQKKYNSISSISHEMPIFLSTNASFLVLFLHIFYSTLLPPVSLLLSSYFCIFFEIYFPRFPLSETGRYSSNRTASFQSWNTIQYSVRCEKRKLPKIFKSLKASTIGNIKKQWTC